jgi:pimeloyl-ACP methyl ester carboxylesterase
MPIVTTDDSELYYERSGDGPRLLFLLGSGSTIEGSRLLLDPFGARFQLLVSDYRGMGRSGPTGGPYDMATCASDALTVMDAVGWESARVCGLSFGGMVAQELAVTAPDRVERLALLCTSAGGAGGSSYPLHELEELDRAERDRVARQLLDTRFDDEWLASHPGDRALCEMLATRADGAGAESRRGAAEQFEARRHHDVWDRLGAITCPTFVACGRHDGIAPPDNSRAIASRIDHADLHVYDGGHVFVVQDRTSLPELFRFLSEPSSAPRSTAVGGRG